MNDYSSVCEGCECQDHELTYHKYAGLMLCGHCYWVADEARYQEISDFESDWDDGGMD